MKLEAPILTYPPLSEIDLKEYRRVYSQIQNPSHVSVLVVQLIDALAQAEQRAEKAEAENTRLREALKKARDFIKDIVDAALAPAASTEEQTKND